MTKSDLQPQGLVTPSTWLRSLTLTERRRCFGGAAEDEPLSFADEESSSLLKRWRSQSPFDSGEWFERRLALGGVRGEADLLRLLRQPTAPLLETDREAPRWALDLLGPLAAGIRHQSGLPESSPPFLRLFAPLLESALAKLGDHLEHLLAADPALPFHPQTTRDLLYREIARTLDAAASQVLALELAVARLEGRLAGATSRDRFDSFIDSLDEPQRAASILCDYPVLARLASRYVRFWLAASCELLDRLAADWRELGMAFPELLGASRLADLAGGAGDRHRQGRAVKLLTFDNGSRLAYKPRPLAADRWFASLLSWIAQRGGAQLASPRTLDRGTYGWTEFVAHLPCGSTAELERFYRRQGAFLAILYLLNAHDFHSENLVACGEHPYLIDLETLFMGDLRTLGESLEETGPDWGLGESVMRVMLLPFLFRQGDRLDAVDPSGLGHAGGDLSLVEEMVWENRQTDELRLVRRRMPRKAQPNRPTLGDRPVNPFSFVGEVVDGFSDMYRFLANRRADLLAADGPLGESCDFEVRAVFRATQLYATLLRQSYHPDVLADALERDRLFDRLWYGLDRSSRQELLLAVLPFEQRDLWFGDIPYFTTRSGSRDVWASRGERLPDLFRRSGLEVARARAATLDEEDLQKQTWFIRGSFASLAWSATDFAPPPYRPAATVTPVSAEEILDLAVQVGDRLRGLALHRGGKTSWIGLTPVPDRGWQMRPLQTDLYSGLPGVILFLAYLAEASGQQELRGLAESSLSTLRELLARPSPRIQSLGAFVGWGGVVYTWIHLASLWREPSLLAEALAFLPQLEALAADDEYLDLTLGAAGAIPPLIALHHRSSAGSPLALARRLGDRLVELARREGEGSGWLASASPRQPLAGLSHGAAGIGLALDLLFTTTGDERFRDTARRALAFERSHFSPAEANWPDLRPQLAKPDGTPQYMAAWCHGATGIGLSRLRFSSAVAGPEAEAEVEAALAATLRKGFGNNHCLCHGDLGSLELLLEALRRRPSDARAQILASRRDQVAASLRQNGWICGVPLMAETPGLMEGLAGIGFGLLRLADAERVPSVLLLDPPATQQPNRPSGKEEKS